MSLREVSRFDFEQAVTPDGFPEASWRRTTDGKIFAYDDTNSRWVEIADLVSLDCSGKPGIGAVTMTDPGHFHDVIFRTSGNNGWRPHADILVIGMFASSRVNAPNTVEVQLMDDGATAISLPWDGTNAVSSEPMVVVEAESKMWMRVTQNTIPTTWPEQWQGGIWYKEIVQP